MDIAKMMQQAQEMMAAQQEIANRDFEYSGNGVKVIVQGNMNIKSIEIEDNLIKSAQDDKSLLEDCVVVAINAALNKAKDTSADAMSGMTGGMDLPPGLSNLFK